MLVVFSGKYSSVRTDECPQWVIRKEQPFTQILVAEQMKPLKLPKNTSVSQRLRFASEYPTIKRSVIKKLYEELKYARMFKQDVWGGVGTVSPKEMEEALYRIPILLATGKPTFKIRTY